MHSLTRSMTRDSDGYDMITERIPADVGVGYVSDRLLWKALLARIMGRLTGRRHGLRPIAQALASHTLCGQHTLGSRMVRMAQIIGSEGRCTDLDDRFRPTQTETCARRHSVAKARVRGIALPPVTLIKIGEAHYVRDGHHRISVARAFGDEMIEFMVTELELVPSAAHPAPAVAYA
jgi:hypothetical protein